MKYYSDLTLAENYLLNFGLQAQKRGVILTQEMILDHFQEENRVSLNKILCGLQRKNYVALEHYRKNTPVRYRTIVPYQTFNTYKCLFKDKNQTEDKND